MADPQVFESLSKEVRHLGSALGVVIQELEGPEVFEQEDIIRRLAKASRAGDASAAEKLTQAPGPNLACKPAFTRPKTCALSIRPDDFPCCALNSGAGMKP